MPHYRRNNKVMAQTAGTKSFTLAPDKCTEYDNVSIALSKIKDNQFNDCLFDIWIRM